MSCVLMLQRGHCGDGCVLTSTLCKYDLRKGDLLVLSWAREVSHPRDTGYNPYIFICYIHN